MSLVQGAMICGLMGLGRNFNKVWASSAISNLGDGVALTAMPLLAATLTRDPLLISGVAFAERLPWLLFSLPGGAIVDRVDRRRLMGAVDLVRAALIGVIGVGLLTDTIGLPVLYLVVFLMGTAEVLFDNASQALMPVLVGRGDLEKANSRLFAAQIVTNEFIGPPAGGLLFALVAAAPFLFDAGSFVAASLLVLSLRGNYRVQREGPSTTLRADIGEGLRWLWMTPLVRRMAVSLGWFNFLQQIPTAVFVLFALERLGVTGFEFGLLLAAGAIGGLIGSVFATRVSEMFGAWSLVWIAAIDAISLVLVGAQSNAFVVGALFAVFGGFGVIWNVITVSTRQAMIPSQMLGRVNSVYRLIGWGSIPLGALAGGAIARVLDLRATFFIAGGALLILTVVYISKTIPDLRAVRLQAEKGPE